MIVPADTAVARARQDDLIPGYRLVQLVGKGGMGEVHQAVQLSLGRTVAVKLLKPELARDEQFVARFEKEAAALATLRHPNIVSIVDRGKSAETYYLVMEFVDGPALRERMRDPDFDTMTALKTLAQVARAIDYAHHRGVIHRDLKPENILFDEQAGGIPKVTDFGLAGFDEKSGQTPQNLTQTNVAMGTASYMAPEQRVDAKTAGPRADLYALGVMLYELLTGELPLGHFDPPSVKKPGVDKRLDGIVARCLKPAPEDRYPSVGAFLAELELLVPMTTAPMPSKETKARRLLRLAKERLQKAARIGALALVGFAAIIVGTVFFRARAEASRKPAAEELLSDDGARFPTSTPGRLDKETRTLTLGEGPDTITVMARGRPVTFEQGGVRFGEPDDAAGGHALVDATVDGEGLRLSAKVDTQADEAWALEPLIELFRGPRPEARSALMLLGTGGRSVMLILSGSGGQPVMEWNLGPDKQGQMRAPLPTSTTGQVAELRLEPSTGELFAVIGEGRDARVLGDGLHLGPYWKNVLGETPRAAVGCLEGACRFTQLTLEGRAVTSALTPPPAPPLEVEVEDLPEPPKKSPSRPVTTTRPPQKPGPVVAATKPPVKPPPPPPAKKPTPPTPPKKGSR
ncbi:MAG: serine/threonine protein kinase [Myxococcaceae bacterium]|jgi:serine/threonine protein kinase|nr:serine/threonine protein kinase [Myxococcaceae bacterium]